MLAKGMCCCPVQDVKGLKAEYLDLYGSLAFSQLSPSGCDGAPGPK